MHKSIQNKILSFLDKDLKHKSIKLFILMILAALAELFSLSLLLVILNFFLSSNFETHYGSILIILENLPFFEEENLLIYFLGIFFFIFTLKITILIIYSWVESKFLAEFKQKISDSLFKNFLYRDTFELLKKNSSEYLRNFTSEIEQTTHFYNSLFKLTLDLIVLFAIFSFLVFFNPTISISVAGIFLALSFSYLFFVKNLILDWGIKSLKSKKLGIQYISESFSAIKYIKMLSREEYFYKKFVSENAVLARIKFKMSFLNSLPRNVFEFVLFITILLLILYLFNNNYSLNEIIKISSVYIITAFRLIPSANRILANIQTLRFSYPSFLKIYKERQIEPIKKKKNIEKFTFKNLIKIEVGSYFYNKKNKFKLKNIKLNIWKKSKIGIIGASGSGKSTLINIICGLTKSKSSRIIVDNKKIYENLEGWQSIVGYIPQKIIILNATLRENILFGLKNKKISDKQILEIIKKSNLYNFYKKQKKGLDQMIKEEGINISGGEIQRIGIARALINEPEIILLDESTSALDTFTENKILKEIELLKKTTIFVSHRLNSLKFCNKIYGINNSTLKEIKNIKKYK